MKFRLCAVSVSTLVCLWSLLAMAEEPSSAESQQDLMSRWVRSWASSPPKTKEASDKLEQEFLRKPMADTARGSKMDPSVENERQSQTGMEPSAAARPTQEPTQEVFVGRQSTKKRLKPTRK